MPLATQNKLMRSTYVNDTFIKWNSSIIDKKDASGWWLPEDSVVNPSDLTIALINSLLLLLNFGTNIYVQDNDHFYEVIYILLY